MGASGGGWGQGAQTEAPAACADAARAEIMSSAGTNLDDRLGSRRDRLQLVSVRHVEEGELLRDRCGLSQHLVELLGGVEDERVLQSSDAQDR